ncbi:hypothetical protein HGRIS_007253 [Hohenbuehelia grisea]|uniref:SH3 domain-containing protein n=1 Tax=Hohenbuehelia grisea TaxID=104357 RepID=A0ABR3JBU0_9AGAR
MRFAAKVAQENRVNEAREKYAAELLRISSCSRQLGQRSRNNGGPEGRLLQQQLLSAQQAAKRNELEFFGLSASLNDLASRWDHDWRDFCRQCQDLERRRMEFMQENIFAFANAFSSHYVTDDESCETLRVTLEHLRPDQQIESFVAQYSSDSASQDLITPFPYDEATPTIPNSATLPDHSPRSQDVPRYQSSESLLNLAEDEKQRLAAEVSRGVSGNPTSNPQSNSAELSADSPSTEAWQNQDPPEYQRFESDRLSMLTLDLVAPGFSTPQIYAPSNLGSIQGGRSDLGVLRSLEFAQSNSMPTAGDIFAQKGQDQNQSLPRPPTQTSSQNESVLFHVQALYDYTADTDQEFGFKKGDIIAVTTTPDHGWWTGQLLDAERRVPGRDVFPSNYVRLF